jgi:hypothetical protein
MEVAVLSGLIVWAAWAWCARRESGWALEVLVGAAAAIVTAGAAMLFQARTHVDWNSVRAAIPWQLAHGGRIYFRPGEGPLWCNIYPPLGFVLQMPVGLGRTPDQVIRIGQGISLAWIVGPMAFLAARLAPGAVTAAERARAALRGGVLALAAVTIVRPIADVATLVHVDGPALGLAVLASAVVMGNPPRWAWGWAGVLAAGSVGCKQTMIAVPVLLFIWAAATGGTRIAGRFAAGFAAAAAALCVGAAAAFGWDAMWYDIVTVPSRHEFPGGLADSVRAGLLEGNRLLAALSLPALAGVLFARGHRTSTTLPLALAAAQIPVSLLGFMKFGGGENNFAYAGIFLLAALVAVTSARGPCHRVATRVLLVLAALASARLLSNQEQSIVESPSPHRQAYDAIRTRPGALYFPWYPLSHLLAEGRETHQSWGVLDRQMAGEPMSDPWLAEYMPPDPRYLCYLSPPDRFELIYARLGPRYPRVAAVPGLPGWTCFAREEARP